MAIEIKELHIKVKIEEEKQLFQQSNNITPAELETLKLQIVRECTAKIMEKLKEREER